MSEASAIAITLRVGQRPPRCIGSGCQMRTPPRRSSAAKFLGEAKLSPVAIGTGECRATSTTESGSWCGTGSSNQSGFEGAMRCAKRIACATPKRQWPSTSRSTRGPMASRTASMRSIASASSSGPTMREVWPKGSNLSAV